MIHEAPQSSNMAVLLALPVIAVNSLVDVFRPQSGGLALEPSISVLTDFLASLQTCQP